jgi:hypothetical protein
MHWLPPLPDLLWNEPLGMPQIDDLALIGAVG